MMLKTITLRNIYRSIDTWIYIKQSSLKEAEIKQKQLVGKSIGQNSLFQVKITMNN